MVLHCFRSRGILSVVSLVLLLKCILTAAVEWIGYCARAVSANQSPDWTLGPFIVQSVLPLVAPALFAASIYMELGRLIVVVHAEKHSLIRVKWMTKIFVTGDVLSFLLQAAGTQPP